jgi:hypothetical protein
MDLVKGFRVIVKAYHTQIIPKHTKVFDTEDKANAYKDILSNEVIWNTAVKVDIETVYMIYDTDEGNYFLLGGNHIKFDE